MNFTSNITSGLHDSIVVGNIFTEINRLVAQATSTVQVVVVLLGIIAALVIAAKGSWRINSIVIGVLVGGLLVDYCRDIGARAVIKGLRSGTDFAYELPMALMNRHLTELETIFVPGDPRFEHVSSSLIREVHALGGDVSGLVPAAVLEAMDAKRG